MDRQEVVAAAHAVGLGEWSEALAREARPSVRLVHGDGAIDGHGSHLGGAPALPPGQPWPTSGGRPQSFIGQLRLDELSHQLGSGASGLGLPTDGLLSFFFDAEQRQWGQDPDERGAWQVGWFPAGTLLEVRTLPTDLDSLERFSARAVTFVEEWTVPPWDSEEMDRVGLPAAFGSGRDIASDGFEALQERLAAASGPSGPSLPSGPSGPSGPRHRMFGFPDQIQGDLRVECELASRGIELGEPAASDEEFEGDANAWQLLLQVDSDEQLGTDWGDAGTIYYWITRDALEARAFERTWLVLQCY